MHVCLRLSSIYTSKVDLSPPTNSTSPAKSPFSTSSRPLPVNGQLACSSLSLGSPESSLSLAVFSKQICSFTFSRVTYQPGGLVTHSWLTRLSMVRLDSKDHSNQAKTTISTELNSTQTQPGLKRPLDSKLHSPLTATLGRGCGCGSAVAPPGRHPGRRTREGGQQERLVTPGRVAASARDETPDATGTDAGSRAARPSHAK